MTINDWIRDELEKGIAAGIEERWETEVEKRMEAEVKKEVEKRMETEVAKEVEKRMEVEKELKNRKETIRNIVKEMIKNNIDFNTISSITKLSKDEILTIQSS